MTSSRSPRSKRVLDEGDEQHAKDVAAFERTHKIRAGALKAAEREIANI